MDSFQLLMNGFGAALQPSNLIFAFIGCLVGTFVGVIPGIGSSTAIAVLIPITFYMDPIPAMIMLASIYYGAQYGGSITSILTNVPGGGEAAITCLEGYPMAKSGRAGAALAISAIGSFAGGTISVLGLMLVAVPLSSVALKFGPTEIFALMILALTLIAGLAGKSFMRAGVSAALGVVVASVGIDKGFGVTRFAFGSLNMQDGIGIVPVVVGLFGLGEVLLSLENFSKDLGVTRAVPRLIPSRKDLQDSTGPILRGTGLGFLAGLVPGLGVMVPTFVSYALEKKLSKTPEKFGTGMIEGVAGPETANNATATSAFVTLFTLGIPGSMNVALIMGALMMHNIIPGPDFFTVHSDLAWAVIASFYVGNVMLLILNLPLIPMWVSLLKLPSAYMAALILASVIVGAYCDKLVTFDIGVVIVFGVVGYAFKKLDIPLAPFCMTNILFPIAERSLRRALQISGGDFGIFLREPIAAAFLSVSAVVLIALVFRKVAGNNRSSSDVAPASARQ